MYSISKRYVALFLGHTMQQDENTDYHGKEELVLDQENMQTSNNAIVDLFIENINSGARVLDFGAGIGTLAKMYRAKTGVTPDCVEVDVLLRELLTENNFALRAINEIDSEYDAVYSSNVLEHIKDDVSALRQLKHALKPGGTLVLYLPAFMCLFSGLDVAVGHYRRYHKTELIEKLHQAGFVIEKIHYCESLGFFASLAVRIFGYNKRTQLGSANSKRFYDKVIYPVGRLLDSIGCKFLFGKNIFVKAKVPS